MRRLLLALLALGLAVLSVATASSVATPAADAAQPPAPRPAAVSLVQAVPGATVAISVDGEQRVDEARVGDIVGPFDLAPGTHDISFTGTDASGADISVDSTLTVKAGVSTDVVLHLPADVGGAPVVRAFSPPDAPIGPGKARVVLAHTATVAPADVQIDGKTVFTNIANGEFAEADVPEGTIDVALLPSGTNGDPILGPLAVPLKASTLSMIYAYGNPRDGSMKVIAHTTPLAADGSVAPSVIDTGSAGLAQQPVATFGTGNAERSATTTPWLSVLWVVAIAAIAYPLRRSRVRRR